MATPIRHAFGKVDGVIFSVFHYLTMSQNQKKYTNHSKPSIPNENQEV